MRGAALFLVLLALGAAHGRELQAVAAPCTTVPECVALVKQKTALVNNLKSKLNLANANLGDATDQLQNVQDLLMGVLSQWNVPGLSNLLDGLPTSGLPLDLSSLLNNLPLNLTKLPTGALDGLPLVGDVTSLVQMLLGNLPLSPDFLTQQGQLTSALSSLTSLLGGVQQCKAGGLLGLVSCLTNLLTGLLPGLGNLTGLLPANLLNGLPTGGLGGLGGLLG